jgi:ankyrin repeat protein
MSTHEPDDSDGDWVKRYRQASDTEAAVPSPATREAILAEGRRVAAERAANPTTHRFDPKQPAANQSRWKLAAAGTIGAALFAAVLMFPHIGAPPNPPSTEMASAPAVSATPSAQSTPAPAPATDALEEVAVTGARREAPSPRTLARKTQAGPSRDAAQLDRSADAKVRKSPPAAGNLTLGAQAEHMAAPAASSAPAAPSALTSQAMRTRLASDSLLSSVQSGDLARVSALLNEGANPEQMDSRGQTPLMLAVIAHRDDLVELLLAHHANPNAADRAGLTPLQRARMEDQRTIIHRLERAGAR